MFAHQILLGGEQGMKYLQIPMNPHAFVGASKVKVASVNAFHLFLNDEAVFSANSKFPYADLKRMWEGGQYFNVKHGAMTASYTFRMPFVYITNQTPADMKSNVSISLEDNDQIIDSFYNRLLIVDLAKPRNQNLIKKVEPHIAILDIHALFWCLLIHEFDILKVDAIKTAEQFAAPRSRYLEILQDLPLDKPNENQIQSEITEMSQSL